MYYTVRKNYRDVHDAGKKAIYNPRALVWHFCPRERLTVKYFKKGAFKSDIEVSFSKYRYYNSEKLWSTWAWSKNG